MQLPRVVIAAVFFVIGALIAIPAILKATSGESSASSTATTSPSPTGSSPSPTKTSGSPTPSRTLPTPTKTRTPTPTPTPTTPRPTPTTSSPPAQPLTATIGAVDCPGRKVTVTVRNRGTQTEDYAIERDDGGASAPGTITGGTTEKVVITLREDRATRIEVTRANDTIMVRTRTANCRTPEALPHTGADDTVIWARAVTGGAAMVTGVIILWYGGIWPRRREDVFGKKAS